MKKVTVEQLAKHVDRVIDATKKDRIMVTRNGKPVALVVSVGNKDEEDLLLEEDEEFWKMIEERRKETKTVPLAEIERELLGTRVGNDTNGRAARSRKRTAKKPT